jgi:hypothetical protein
MPGIRVLVQFESVRATISPIDQRCSDTPASVCRGHTQSLVNLGKVVGMFWVESFTVGLRGFMGTLCYGIRAKIQNEPVPG